MKAITSKWKTWSVIFVVILFVGMVLFGVTGLNKSINAKEHYELQVKVVHIQDADKELLQNSVENYFKDNSLAPVYSATEKYNGGETLVYKFTESVESNIAGLKGQIETVLNGKGLTVEITQNLYKPSAIKYVGSIITYAVFAVVAFVILLIFNKFKNAIISILSGIFTGLFALALSAIARIPVGADFISILLFSSIASTFVTACTTRIAKNKILNSNESSFACADKGVLKYLPSIAMFLGVLLVSALSLVILGNTLIKEIALAIIVCIISVGFISITVAPSLWAFVFEKKGATTKSEETPLKD